MGNGRVIAGQEHFDLTPFEYSNDQEREQAAALETAPAPEKQTYLPFWYNSFRYLNYAGIFIFTPPNPVIIPSRRAYNGIAPMRLQPTINPPFPYELNTNYERY